MKIAATVAQMIVRLCGLVQITLGVLFWTGRSLPLIPVHMLVGLVLVLSLWVLALLAARAGVNLGFVALAILWGIFVLVFGMAQSQLLIGDAHWVIQVLHLLVGLAAIGQAERLAAGIKQTREAPAPASQPLGHKADRVSKALTRGFQR